MEKFIKSLGGVSAVIGAQWGDEGKGKVVDILGEHFDVIARASGGANAGHTIVVAGKKHVFHLLPSACLHEGKPVVLGSGMVIHLPTLLEEIETLKESNIQIVKRLHISGGAHILFNYHKEIDAFLEGERSKNNGKGIGTTKRGIGPAYMDKAERVGLRLESFLTLSETEVKTWLQQQASRLESRYKVSVDVAGELAQWREAKELLHDQIEPNVPLLLNGFREAEKKILVEGAQATLLDLDHGTYPYVTSSNTTTAGALHALGLPPSSLTSNIGVAKAYCTRVGEGDFLTEATETDGQRLRDRGGEYGSTTGRPRRCGWLDLEALKQANIINGFKHWNITKLDVLDEEETIPVNVGVDGKGKAQYENLPGWQESTVGITDFKKLPKNAQKYIEFIEHETKVQVALIGTGQAREAMIIRN